jgi:hypothetical protein
VTLSVIFHDLAEDELDEAGAGADNERAAHKGMAARGPHAARRTWSGTRRR